MALLPARKTKEEAQAEIDRLEKNRAENNEAAKNYKTTGFRGECFMKPKRDDEVWSYKEIHSLAENEIP